MGIRKIIFIVADEIQDHHKFFAGGFPKSPAQLLDKDNSRLGGPEHDHLIDLRNIHTLGEISTVKI